MAFLTYNGIKVSGISGAVPTKTVYVNDFIPEFGEGVIERFKKTTHIEQFREAHEKQTASDLGCAAAENLLTKKEVNRDDIGFLFFVSQSFDYLVPSTACVLQHRLGLSEDCAAMDVGLTCSGAVYGILTAGAALAASDKSKALVIMGTSGRRNLSLKNRASVMLMGDAGCAVLLEKTDQDTKISGILRTDGSRFKDLITPAGGARNKHASRRYMKWPDGNMRTLYQGYMNGLNVFNFSVTEAPKVINDFTEKEQRPVQDYDAVILHQANYVILKQIIKKIKADKEKVPIVIDKYGNTGVATIPLAISETYGNAADQKLDLLLCGFGAGLSWGVTSITVEANDILPVIETDDYFEAGLINSPADL